jgi:hypothetical protein
MPEIVRFEAVTSTNTETDKSVEISELASACRWVGAFRKPARLAIRAVQSY